MNITHGQLLWEGAGVPRSEPLSAVLLWSDIVLGLESRIPPTRIKARR